MQSPNISLNWRNLPRQTASANDVVAEFVMSVQRLACDIDHQRNKKDHRRFHHVCLVDQRSLYNRGQTEDVKLDDIISCCWFKEDFNDLLTQWNASTIIQLLDFPWLIMRPLIDVRLCDVNLKYRHSTFAALEIGLQRVCSWNLAFSWIQTAPKYNRLIEECGRIWSYAAGELTRQPVAPSSTIHHGEYPSLTNTFVKWFGGMRLMNSHVSRSRLDLQFITANTHNWRIPSLSSSSLSPTTTVTCPVVKFVVLGGLVVADGPHLGSRVGLEERFNSELDRNAEIIATLPAYRSR